VAVMAALAVVIFAEKLWRHGKRFGQAVGVLLVAIGCWPSGSRGCFRLHVSAMPACRTRIAFKEEAMSYARQMLDTYSRTFNVDVGLLAAAIDALSDCVQACNADNAADLGERT